MASPLLDLASLIEQAEQGLHPINPPKNVAALDLAKQIIRQAREAKQAGFVTGNPTNILQMALQGGGTISGGAPSQKLGNPLLSRILERGVGHPYFKPGTKEFTQSTKRTIPAYDRPKPARPASQYWLLEHKVPFSPPGSGWTGKTVEQVAKDPEGIKWLQGIAGTKKLSKKPWDLEKLSKSEIVRAGSPASTPKTRKYTQVSPSFRQAAKVAIQYEEARQNLTALGTKGLNWMSLRPETSLSHIAPTAVREGIMKEGLKGGMTKSLDPVFFKTPWHGAMIPKPMMAQKGVRPTIGAPGWGPFFSFAGDHAGLAPAGELSEGMKRAKLPTHNRAALLDEWSTTVGKLMKEGALPQEEVERLIAKSGILNELQAGKDVPSKLLNLKQITGKARGAIPFLLAFALLGGGAAAMGE